jgi:hypothetical protein
MTPPDKSEQHPVTSSVSSLLSLKRKTRIEAWVDPLQIVYAKHQKDWPWYVRRWPLLGCPGSWDCFNQALEPFRVEELRGIILGGEDFKRTPRYQDMLKQLQEKGRTRFPRCESQEEIDAYYEGVFKLADSMRREGYRPSAETGAQGDIDVRIDRFGRLLKCGQGTHRLAMAYILKVSRVLVRIDLVHTQWLATCVRPSEAETIEALQASIKQPVLSH